MLIISNISGWNMVHVLSNWLAVRSLLKSGLTGFVILAPRLGSSLRSARCRSVISAAKSIKGVPGLFEYRIDAGPGYRIYYRVSGRTVVLLWGGPKRTQTRDIERARTFARLLD